MRKLLIFGIIFLLSSCAYDSIYNHQGDVVVEKIVYQKHPKHDVNYYVYIRTKISGVYVIKKLHVPKLEYCSVELGDTITK